jgi:hypothetical protein
MVRQGGAYGARYWGCRLAINGRLLWSREKRIDGLANLLWPSVNARIPKAPSLKVVQKCYFFIAVGFSQRNPNKGRFWL